MTDTLSAQDERRALADQIEKCLVSAPNKPLDRPLFHDDKWHLILAALRAEPARGVEMSPLSDPVAVHANMLRGVIARPSVENIIHLYGADNLRRALPAQGGGE